MRHHAYAPRRMNLPENSGLLVYTSTEGAILGSFVWCLVSVLVSGYQSVCLEHTLILVLDTGDTYQ